MGKFKIKKLDHEIEAIKFNGNTSLLKLINFIGEGRLINLTSDEWGLNYIDIYIDKAKEETGTVQRSDYIVKLPDGSFDIHRSDYIESIYEEIVDD